MISALSLPPPRTASPQEYLAIMRARNPTGFTVPSAAKKKAKGGKKGGKKGGGKKKKK